jgi:hypothetical protein
MRLSNIARPRPDFLKSQVRSHVFYHTGSPVSLSIVVMFPRIVLFPALGAVQQDYSNPQPEKRLGAITNSTSIHSSPARKINSPRGPLVSAVEFRWVDQGPRINANDRPCNGEDPTISTSLPLIYFRSTMKLATVSRLSCPRRGGKEDNQENTYLIHYG